MLKLCIATHMILLFLVTVPATAKDDRAPRVLPQLLYVKDLPDPPGPTGKSPTDTLYLLGEPGTLSGQFQDACGLPDRQGWLGVDLTASDEIHWQVSPFRGAELDPLTPDNQAWWCGAILESCGPGDLPEGYGDDWAAYLDWYGTVPDPGDSVTVRVKAVLSCDTEPGFDYIYLEASTAGYSPALFTRDARRTAVKVDVSATLAPEDYLGAASDQVHLRWRFFSDGAWDDEDCLWPTAGAAVIDLIEVWFDQGSGEIQIGTTETCEPGDPLQWTPTPRIGAGDYSKVWPLLEDLDPERENDTPQFAFIDDGVVVPGTGGSTCISWCYGPGGFVANTDYGLSDPRQWVDNEIWSQVLEVPPGGYDGAIFSFDVYIHSGNVIRGNIFPKWHVRSTDDPTGSSGWTEWRDRGYMLVSEPAYLRLQEQVSDLLVPGCTFVQLALGVSHVDYWGTQDATPAPYFDNVSFKVYQSPRPSVLHVLPDGSGDYATIQEAISAAAVGDTVSLADGVYTGQGNRDIDFHGKAVTLMSANGDPRTCIIDCEGSVGDAHRGFAIVSGEGVETRLVGVTIRNGYLENRSGAGILCQSGSSPMIEACILSNNIATGSEAFGGGVFSQESSPSFIHCIFQGNTGGSGGAIAASAFDATLVTITGCVFENNTAQAYGSGLYVSNSGCRVEIENCTFYGNHDPTNSGCVTNRSTSVVQIDNSIIAFGTGGYGALRSSGTAETALIFTCSNIFGNELGDWTSRIISQLGTSGNISLDPQFCLVTAIEPLSLHTASPCAAVNSGGCGQIGAKPVGCGALSGIQGDPDDLIPTAGPVLHPAYPNPFNPTTTISIDLPRQGAVGLRIFDISGRLVRALMDGEVCDQGRHEAVWDGRDNGGKQMSSGTYFYRLQTGSYSETKRMMLVK